VASGESLESGGWFYVGAFDRNVASVAMKMFSSLIYFIKRAYKWRVQVLTATSLMMKALWVITPYSLVGVD
jgi:hypothetical protein